MYAGGNDSGGNEQVRMQEGSRIDILKQVRGDSAPCAGGEVGSTEVRD